MLKETQPDKIWMTLERKRTDGNYGSFGVSVGAQVESKIGFDQLYVALIKELRKRLIELRKDAA